MKIVVDRLKDKSDIAKSDGDFAYLFSILVSGEAIAKIITLLAVSSLDADENRHQYQILHGLVRANGIGDWSKALDELLVGTASQHLTVGFQKFQTEMTRKTSIGEWQNEAVVDLEKCLELCGIPIDNKKEKRDLKSWFRLFAMLRNRTRGHGATNIEKGSIIAPLLAKSIQKICENISILQIPVAYIKRNLSGKYRVTPLNDCGEHFDELKATKNGVLEDGLYLSLDGFREIHLVASDPQLEDFYIANGGFTASKFEMLSYVTDNKIQGDSALYLNPVGMLPTSESQGLGELMPVGNCFSNVPMLSYDYISRGVLESDLTSVLLDDRRALITLLGRGGIGKTSLALRVIPTLYDESRFDVIVWFSSRDIDLQSRGAKLVKADVVTKSDFSDYYARLTLSEEIYKAKDFSSIEYFQEQLSATGHGPCLFVFDNFETTENPLEIFKWIDTFVRSPNKVLITTRLRDFNGDYQLQVGGMNQQETRELVVKTAGQKGVMSQLTDAIVDEIYRVSVGHPYIVKMLVGHLAQSNMKGAIPRIVAGSEEILRALFERTYAALSPCAQRVFLTLASWNSAAPKVAVQAILSHSIGDGIEVENAVEQLLQYSMIEEAQSMAPESQYFVGLPFVATVFGRKKVSVSAEKVSLDADVRILRRFGVSALDDKRLSFKTNFLSFMRSLEDSKAAFEEHKELLENICWSYNDGWMWLTEWLLESTIPDLNTYAKQYLTYFLENETRESQKAIAWKIMAHLSKESGDCLGEVHSLIEAAQLPGVSFYELSNSANIVNRRFKSGELVLDDFGTKNDMLRKFFDILWKRKKESDANDYSRIAWLALHLNLLEQATRLVVAGLVIDPTNRHCIGLKDRLAT